MKRRYISKNNKILILKTQDYKCANTPFKPALNLQNYQCKLWKYENGDFDEAGYQIDHIDEYCISKNNHVSNLQALCPDCHAVKTRRFLKQKKQLNSWKISNGCVGLEIFIELPDIIVS